MNPFTVESKDVNAYFMDWKKMYSKPYNKKTVDPFTKVRVILMNGTEFESISKERLLVGTIDGTTPVVAGIGG